jgi:hypothetical protein
MGYGCNFHVWYYIYVNHVVPVRTYSQADKNDVLKFANLTF